MSYKAAVLIASLLAANAANAQNTDSGMRGLAYFGVGQANSDDPLENDDTPFSFGFMMETQSSNLLFGFDIGFEGTMIDSTWGKNEEISQAQSYNLLVGTNLYREKDFTVDGAVMLGIKETFSDCPDSYLGYQCYADTDPETEYEANYGAVFMLSYKGFAIGGRATSESMQLVTGIRF